MLKQARRKEAIGAVFLFAACLAWGAIIPLAAAPLSRPYTVENYDVIIHPDLVKQRLIGEATIRLHSQADTPISALEVDAGALQVQSVLEGQTSQYFERKGRTLAVVLTNPLRPDESRTLTVRYQAGPAPGLKFFPDQTYTSEIGDWLPCNDRPGERATLRLTIAAPKDAKVAGSGQLTETRAGGGETITEWRLDSPTAPSGFGFALGNFAENTSDAEAVKLRVLGAGAQVLEPTAAAMTYLSERSGKRYPGPTYTQVFIHGDAARSFAAGLTLLPDSDAPGLPKQPDALRLLTSALAHQWYGFEISPKDWSDLWLSEGVSAFLADSFLGQRLGKEVYEREIQHSRQIYNQFSAQGKDRSLSYTEWTTRQDADGEIPIHKGVCFLYLAHELVGDSGFWEGLRLYTSEQWGKAAASEDFQSAFQATSGANRSGAKMNKRDALARKNNAKTLDNLFDLWVYGIPSGKSK